MSNRLSFFFLLVIVILAFPSCTKETLTPQQTAPTVTERNTTIEIEVTEIAHTDTGAELIVNFSAGYDFSGAVVETGQFLNFTDGASNLSTLPFQVNGYSGSNGNLQVNFDLETNNIAGLDLVAVQEIIIDETIE